jgi:hypothetical protein
LFVSCEKELPLKDALQETPSNNLLNSVSVQVKDGILSFENVDEFHKVRRMLAEAPTEERINWERSMGFYSMQSEYEDILTELENAQTKEEYEEILYQNSHIIYIDEENIIRPYVEIGELMVSTNSKGIVFVGKHAHRYTKTHHYISLNGDPSLISGDIIKIDGKNVVGHEQFPESTKIGYTCGTYHRKVSYYDGDRMAELIIRVTLDAYQINQSSNEYRIYTTALARGNAYKKNFWGNWVSYNTNNYLDYDFSARVNHLSYSVVRTQGYKSNNDEEYIIQSTRLVDGVIATPDQFYLYEGFLTQINNTSYRHRGMDVNWTTIYCSSIIPK